MKTLNNNRYAPTLSLEQELWGRGLMVVAGVDEVGRGPLAGPVMAAAVVFPRDLKLSPAWCTQVRDSKTLSPAQREQALVQIQAHVLALGVGSCQPWDIDDIGIVEATRTAMRRAVEALPLTVDYLLIDYITLPGVPCRGVVGGDALCFSIAAASIVAKVERDRLMVEMDARHRGYGFAQHKGYGTPQHLRSLALLGPSPIHRRSFSPVRCLDDTSAMGNVR